MKRINKILILVVIVILGMLVFYNVQQRISTNRYIEDHMIANQHNTLLFISQELQFFVMDYGPYNKIEEIIDKVQDEDDKLILTSRGYNFEDKVFYDNWGTAIKLKVVSQNEHHLISAGPNKKHEDGNGDDIMFSFNPLKSLEDYNELVKKYQSEN